MKKKELRKALAALGVEETPSKPRVTLGTAVSMMKAAADVAEAQGDHTRAAGIRQEVCVTKMQIAERARSRSGVAVSKRGPNTAELFASGLNTLPDDDTGLRYL